MAETPSDPSPAPPHPQSGSVPQYWCYQCDKRVAVETLATDVVCYDCKTGFIESIPAAPITDEEMDDPIDEHSVEVLHDEEVDNRRRYTEKDRSDGDDENEIEVSEPRDDEEEMRRRLRGVPRLRLRDFDSRAATRRNRILDWAEILMGLEDHSIELRLQSPDSDTYIGNPGDYVDAAGYEALLQNLAESDSGAKRGAPPAAKSAVDGLESLVISEEEKAIMCAICKDSVNNCQVGKSLPCGHGYHGDCIVPWLETRNSCPVCRFKLPTDDPEYEEERKKRAAASSSGSSGESAVE